MVRIRREGAGPPVVAATAANAARAAAQLTLVQRRAQPIAAYITRMTLTAVFAYLAALQLTPHEYRPVLAPLTALLEILCAFWPAARRRLVWLRCIPAGRVF